RRPEAGVIEIFFAIFAHRPLWMNLMLIARNKIAGFAGLQTPTTSEILNMEKRDRYIVGQKIGPWPIFFLGPDELVAGRDNQHMDFRLSIMKVHDVNGRKSRADLDQLAQRRVRQDRRSGRLARCAPPRGREDLRHTDLDLVRRGGWYALRVRLQR